MTYRERAAMLAAVVKVLQARRDDYYAIATANSGTVKNDSAVDIDGGIYTLSTYAKLGETLARAPLPARRRSARPAKGAAVPEPPRAGARRAAGALHQRLQLPGWGLWEKAAPALLSGVPVVGEARHRHRAG